MGSRETAAGLRRRLEPLVEALTAEGLPISMADGPPATVDRLRPSVWVEDDGLTSAIVRRSPHVSEGDDTLMCQIDVYRNDAEDVHGILDASLHEIARLLRQDREIVSEGGDPEAAPARHHRAHPLLVDALKAWGWDMEDAVRPTAVAGMGGLVLARSENGVFTDLMADDIDGRSVMLTRRIVRRRIIVDSLSIMPPHGTSREEPGILFSEQEGVPLITISRMVLPDSALASLQGERVGRILDGGAASAFAHHVIEDAWVSGGSSAGPDMTTLRLAGGDTPIM